MNNRRRLALFCLPLTAALVLAACRPTGTPLAPTAPAGAPTQAATGEPVLPTTEPTSDQAATDACILSGYQSYIDPQGAFCFAYSPRFTPGEFAPGQPGLIGPALGSAPESRRASLGVDVQPAEAGSDLPALVDAFLRAAGTPSVTRTAFTLGGLPAELVEGVLGGTASRDLFALHGERLVHLVFTPLAREVPSLRRDVDDLFRTVTSTFDFTGVPPAPPAGMPSREPVPTSCQVAGKQLYASPYDGFCFAYPGRFGVEASGGLAGPWLDASLEAVAVSLAIAVTEVPDGSSLDQLADQALAEVQGNASLQRQAVQLGGEPAILAEPVPGQLSARMVFALRGTRLLRLTFWPVDSPQAKGDFQDLYQSVTSSFSYLPRAVNASPCAVPGYKAYTRTDGAFCLSLPERFTVNDPPAGGPDVTGPALDASAEPLRAALQVEVQPAPAGKTLAALVEAFVGQINAAQQKQVERGEITVGGETAIRLDNVPGRSGSRDIFLLHGWKLIHLAISPSARDFPLAALDVEDLDRSVTTGLRFLDGANPPPTPTPTPTLGATSISGKVCGLEGGVPALTAYLQNTETQTTTELSIAPGQTAYQVELEPGSYILYAWLPDFSRGVLYSKAVPCGLKSGCDDRSPETFTVAAGQSLKGIDLCDWYAGPFNIPYPPGYQPDQTTGSISGWIAYPGSAPALQVVATNMSTHYWYYVETNPGASSFTIEELPPGQYQVVAYGPDGTAGACAASDHSLTPAAVKPGQSASCDVTDWSGSVPPNPAKP